MVASILDPRYKRLKFLNAEQVYNYTKQLIPSADECESATTETNIDVKLECPSPPKKTKNTSDFNSVMSFLGVDDLIDLDNDNQNLCLEQEFQDDLNDKHMVENPLHWWQSNVHRFPMLGSVVKNFLAIPATSVPSERAFSTAGLTVTKLRSALDAETVDALIFLNKNMR